ncbi:glutaredoxin 3 [Maritalea mediterranea]|uniref:Glutaredoxin n=1 Tax=Maritalea mediterranea TaxID=2909667 RepID=A0ABS9E9E6_9HYPH|nr:glutaredoxin 3 [Maritalea mediterranea]MCF4099499.1 glutaredoxin 3 [Maritalea mediterranea]
MPKIELYTTPTCPYCLAAKALLNKKGASFTEITVVGHPQEREKMIQRANGKQTVPQIFIDDYHVGGFDELSAMDRAGKLDPLLEDRAAS